MQNQLQQQTIDEVFDAICKEVPLPYDEPIPSPIIVHPYKDDLYTPQISAAPINIIVPRPRDS